MPFKEAMEITDKEQNREKKRRQSELKNSDSLRYTDLQLWASWAFSAQKANQKGVHRHILNHTWHAEAQKGG